MDDYLGMGFDDQWGEPEDEYNYEEDFAPADPFEGMTKRDQDIFFRLLDLLPREHLEPAMDYFMSHPTKMRALVDYVKQKKEILDNGDEATLRELFEREQIVIKELEQMSESNE